MGMAGNGLGDMLLGGGTLMIMIVLIAGLLH